MIVISGLITRDWSGRLDLFTENWGSGRHIYILRDSNR